MPPPSHNKKEMKNYDKKKTMDEMGREGEQKKKPLFVSLFAERLADAKEVKKKLATVEAEVESKELKVYRLETSYIADYKSYQDAAVAAGLMKEENVITDFGRHLSESSSSWVERLQSNPALAFDGGDGRLSRNVKEEEEEESNAKPDKSNRKRKR